MEIVSTKTKLTDDQRGQLIVSAACYGVLWSLAISTPICLMAWIWFPENILSALGWYPLAFVAVFLRKRHKLLEQANEIIAYHNKRIDQA